MDVTQMLCHLREAYLFALASGPVEHIRLPVPPRIAKYVALGPMTWPKNLPTLAQLRIGGASMKTATFAEDQSSLMAAYDRFCSATNLTREHPFFTTMTHENWMQWGYRHADHHLRQFGR